MTTWMPLPRPIPRQFLLANGDIIAEPAMEVSGSYRKVRIVRSEASVYISETEMAVGQYATQEATNRGTAVLADVTTAQGHVENVLGFDPDSTPAVSHLVHNADNSEGETIAWWRFRHPQIAYEVYVVAKAARSKVPYYRREKEGEHNVEIQFMMPLIDRETTALMPAYRTSSGNNLQGMVDRLPSEYRSGWETLIATDKPSWLDQLTMQTTTPQGSVRCLQGAVAFFEDQQFLRVPDFSDPSKPAWFDLEIQRTNVTPDLESDLAEYLDGGGGVTALMETYRTLLDQMRTLGIGVNETLTENDFHAAALSGNRGRLNILIENVVREGADRTVEHDNAHSLSLNLPSGAFTVNCDAGHEQREDAANRWDELHLIAEMTGETPKLLAFAQAFGAEQNTARTNRIMRNRKGER